MQAEAGAALNSTEGAGAEQPRRPGASRGVDPGPAPRASSRRGLVPALLAVAVAVYVLDRVTKAWALSALVPGEKRPWLGEILQLHLIFNPGAAFSVGTGATWVFTLVQAGVSLAILLVSRRLAAWPWALAAGLVLGGATGNLTDRLTRPPGVGVGHVVDFLELPHWPIFNVADSAIVAGAIVAAAASLFGVPVFGRRTDATEGTDATDGTDGTDGTAAAPAADERDG